MTGAADLSIQAHPLIPKCRVVRDPAALIVHIFDTLSIQRSVLCHWSLFRVFDPGQIGLPELFVIRNPLSEVVHIAHALRADSDQLEVVILDEVHPENMAVRPPVAIVEHEFAAHAVDHSEAELRFRFYWLGTYLADVSVPE